MLDRCTSLVKERVAFLRLIDTHDILDAASGAATGVALLHATVSTKWAGIAIDTVYKEC